MKKFNKTKLKNKLTTLMPTVVTEDENEPKKYKLFKVTNSNNEVVHVISVDVSAGQTPPTFSISVEDWTGTSEELTKKKQDLKQ